MYSVFPFLYSLGSMLVADRRVGIDKPCATCYSMLPRVTTATPPLGKLGTLYMDIPRRESFTREQIAGGETLRVLNLFICLSPATICRHSWTRLLRFALAPAKANREQPTANGNPVFRLEI